MYFGIHFGALGLTFGALGLTFRALGDNFGRLGDYFCDSYKKCVPFFGVRRPTNIHSETLDTRH